MSTRTPAPCCAVRLLTGAHVLLEAKDCYLEAASGDAPLPPATVFPHRIRGVFPVTGADEPTGRVYVLLDGPDPLVELDVVARRYHAVQSAATQEAYMKRWRSSAALTNLVPSPSGRFVAVALDDGRVVLHKLCADHGKPTFEAVGVWPFGRGAAVHITGMDVRGRNSPPQDGEAEGAADDDDADTEDEDVALIFVTVSRRGSLENCRIDVHGGDP